MKILARRDDAFGGDIEIRIGDPVGKKVVTGLVVEDLAPGQYVNPVVSISPEEAQCLVNQLWECGIRPAQGAGSAGQLDAVQGHLEDMRRIVGAQLNIPLPIK